jgi:hypothetical protein
MIEDFKTGEEPLFESFLEKVDSKGYEETVTLSPLAFMLCGMDDFDKASIHLEESLYKKLTGSVSEERELVELWIKRLASSLWRSSHLHSFNGADLSIFKPGNTSDRAACIIKGENLEN